MANDRLRDAMSRAGLQVEDLMALTGASEKTVRRWLAGKNPYTRHRITLAHALDTTEQDLWPHLAPTTPPAPEDRVRAHTGLTDPNLPDWRAWVRAATGRIDLLDALAHVLTRPGIPDLLADRASAGCQVRILIASEIDLTDLAADQLQDEPDTDGNRQLHRENQQARRHLHRIRDSPNLEAREFAAPRFTSIIRADNHMLATLHLHGLPTADAPILHIEPRSDIGIFDRFADHFDQLWARSDTMDHDPDRHPDPDTTLRPNEPASEPAAPAGRHQKPAAEPSPADGEVRPPPAFQKRPWPRRS